MRIKHTSLTGTHALVAFLTIRTTVIHIETLHQNLPKGGLIGCKLDGRCFEDFQPNTNAAVNNKAQNRIGRNRTGQKVSIARVPIDGTIELIRRLHCQRGATVIDSEVLVVRTIGEQSGVKSRISEFVRARVVPEVQSGKCHRLPSLVETEDSVTDRRAAQLGQVVVASESELGWAAVVKEAEGVGKVLEGPAIEGLGTVGRRGGGVIGRERGREGNGEEDENRRKVENRREGDGVHGGGGNEEGSGRVEKRRGMR